MFGARLHALCNRQAVNKRFGAYLHAAWQYCYLACRISPRIFSIIQPAMHEECARRRMKLQRGAVAFSRL